MPSSVAKHTIPPFYACYFLRSLSSPGSTYIGSTPAPPRRKRQHNGDLTQGAHKTARARPWEMECIVYGFPSKIAALQFEWAWAKPHLSRHLKFLTSEYSAEGTSSDTSAWHGMPLFPSTSMTPGQTRWGRTKRRMARPPSTPNARLLAMRALIRSEPFCGWGLKLAFFTEWSWLAYQRLETTHEVTNTLAYSGTPTALRLERYSRSGKPLHPVFPIAVCDFTSVDGKRIPLVHVSRQRRLDAGVADLPAKKRASSSKETEDIEETPQWPEALPRMANLKGLNACVQDFKAFPLPQPAISNTDLTRKLKRIMKTTKDAAAVETAVKATEGENEGDEDDAGLNAGTASTTAAEPGSLSSRLLNRMRFDDLDVEESEWKRLEYAIFTHCASSSSNTPGQAMSDFMQICVQRHIAAQDECTLHEAPAAPRAPCGLCQEPVDLTRQLDLALCHNTHSSMFPADQLSVSTSVVETGIGRKHTCGSVFHFTCLADSFLQQGVDGREVSKSSSINTVLPTHGMCPSHSGELGGVASWADVVRAAYRRSERFDRLVEFLVRSGRTLAEHLNPVEEAATAKPKKARGPPKASTKNTQVVVGAEESDEGQASRTTAKAAGGRKRRQPGATISGSIESDQQSTQASASADSNGAGTIRKVSRKAKAVHPADVIDLR